MGKIVKPPAVPAVKLPSDFGKTTTSTWTATTKFGFPHKIRGGLLQLFRMIPFGWRDLGNTRSRGDGTYTITRLCARCCTRLRIGTEQNVDGERELFSYCPTCMEKIDATV